MNTSVQKLQQLVAENKIDRAFQLLGEDSTVPEAFKTKLFTIQSNFKDLRLKENMGMLSNSELFNLKAKINYSLLELLNELDAPPQPDQKISGEGNEQSVFISYNHNDSGIANRLKDKLTSADITVLIDSEHMLAGDDIAQFIDKSVRNSGTTISIISKKSLLSAWVAMETVETFQHEKTGNVKKFLACYADDDFFKRSYTDEALDHIEAEITAVQLLIAERMKKNRSIRDLQNELTRLTDLRNNLDEIVRRLRESLCIDIRGEQLDNNFSKITEAIHSK